MSSQLEKENLHFLSLLPYFSFVIVDSLTGENGYNLAILCNLVPSTLKVYVVILVDMDLSLNFTPLIFSPLIRHKTNQSTKLKIIL